MILSIDHGNSGIKAYVYRDDERSLLAPDIGPLACGRLAPEALEAGLAALVERALARTGRTAGNALRCALVSVRPDLMDRVLAAVRLACGVEATAFSSEGTLRCLYEDPAALGADRMAAAYAAVRLYPNQALVVADAGTALTVDAISATGTFLGGAIAPGKGAWVEGLSSKAPRLAARLAKPGSMNAAPPGLGRSTEGCLSLGFDAGFRAMTLGLIRTVRQRAFGTAPCGRILCGAGAAKGLLEDLSRPPNARPGDPRPSAVGDLVARGGALYAMDRPAGAAGAAAPMAQERKRRCE